MPVAFFEDSDDRPGGSASRGSRTRGPGADPQTLRLRRAAAAGAGLVILVLLIFAVRGCLNAREERAFKDYVRDVGALLQESDQQSRQFFDLLRDPTGQSPVDMQNRVNEFRVQAAQLVDRARDTDHPGELDGAQRFFVDTLEFRRDGLGAIADDLPTALGDTGRREATDRIAGQMLNFLASDVIYSQRVIPALQTELRDKDLLGEARPPESQFLPDIDWLRPRTVEDRLSRVSGEEGAGGSPRPGLHGTGLAAVTVMPAGRALVAGAAAEIKATEDVSFDIQVENQGENDERDVTVRVAITGAGRPIELEERIEAIAAGQTETVTIPLANTPPIGRPVDIEVEIRPVPGERKTDNNKGSFPAVFTR